MVPKVIRDGKVAVLVSPGFGAGWYSWNYGKSFGTAKEPEALLFDPDLVSAVEAGDYSRAVKIAEEKWPEAYHGGVEDLQIKWVPIGSRFRIHEYDGSESLVFSNEDDWVIA